SCCGAVALRVVAGLHGQDVKLSDIREQVQADRFGRTSLASLAQAARARGYEAVGLEIPSDRLELCTVPLIAHRPPDHFVVLLGLGRGRGVAVLDPPSVAWKMSDVERKSGKTWRVLAVSREKLDIAGAAEAEPSERPASEISRRKGPLVFENAYWDFGRLEPNRKRKHTFRFRNAGNKPVTLSRAKVTCGCLSVLSDEQAIQPGQRGELAVELDTAGMIGRIRKRVLCAVTTAGSEMPTAFALDVAGEISRRGQIALEPDQLHVTLWPGAAVVRKTVLVRAIGGEPLEVSEAVASAGFISCQLAPVDDEPAASVSERRLTIRIRPPDELGPVEEAVVLHSSDPNEPQAVLRVRGRCVSPVQPLPERLLLGTFENPRRLRLRHRGGQPFRILSIEGASSGAFEPEFDPRAEAVEHVITLRPLGPVDAGMIRGMLRIATDAACAPEIEVAYSGLGGWQAERVGEVETARRRRQDRD
ncbi:MAG: DUF1573 domain-containing protein, partial [Planctomycetota bacterium]